MFQAVNSAPERPTGFARWYPANKSANRTCKHVPTECRGLSSPLAVAYRRRCSTLAPISRRKAGHAERKIGPAAVSDRAVRKVRVDLGHEPNRRARVLGQRQSTKALIAQRQAQSCELAHRPRRKFSAKIGCRMISRQAGTPGTEQLLRASSARRVFPFHHAARLQLGHHEVNKILDALRHHRA